MGTEGTVYALLKYIHIVAVILALGNASLGPFRRSQARATGDPKIIAGTYGIQTRSGPLITIPWFVAAIVTGLGMTSMAGIPLLSTGWAFWALVLSVVVGLMFLVAISPRQRVATSAAEAWASSLSAGDQQAFDTAARRIEPLSHTAHLIFLVILALMVFKPHVSLPW
jgi:uncharacterized membrane protein